MLISYNWLCELTGTKLDPQELRERLTNVGLAVDAVAERGGDFVLDVEVPSNRGDCLSHVGIAREVAVIEKSEVQTPKFKAQPYVGKPTDLASVEIRDLDLCPRYAARVVRGVKIGPSPDWLVTRLEAIGQRSINNVADITNYVLHELGQPLHAFNLAKLPQGKIIVRRAQRNESIKTLDGVERKLDDQMLVIADVNRPVAIAGVMGGEDSEISETTTDVLIESAYFNPASVRRTAKLLGLHTEASHRFERGTDFQEVLWAQERCVSLICEIAGGLSTGDAIDVNPASAWPKLRGVEIRRRRLEALTSLRVSSSEMLRILTGLVFIQAGSAASTPEDERLAFIVPSWRGDVSIEEDLIEEVARHTGYEKIAVGLPPASLPGEYHSTEKRKRALRQALAAHAFNEAISFSFIDAGHDDQFELIPAFQTNGTNDAGFVSLQNPIIENWTRMRPSLLPGLLGAVRHNLNQGTRDVSLFELGRIFRANGKGELPEEREALALVATGGMIEAGRAKPLRETDFFDLKGAFESACDAMSLPPLDFSAADNKHLRAGQAAEIAIHGTRVGSIGRLAENIAADYKFRQPVYVGEIDLTALLEIKELPVLYSALPRFPSILRDVSFLVDRKITVGELLLALNKLRTSKCIGAEFVGTYEGEGIPEDKRSVTIRLEYRAEDRTLRDEEVDEIHWPLVETLKKRFAAEVR